MKMKEKRKEITNRGRVRKRTERSASLDGVKTTVHSERHLPL